MHEHEHEHERAEAEDIVRAIRQGEVDAFVVTEAAEERIYSLRSADVLYRAMIEEMKDGAVALDASGLIIYCNAYFAQIVKADRERLVGGKIFPFAPGDGAEFFATLREQMHDGTTRRELELRASDGTIVPVLAAMNRIQLDTDNHVFCLVVTDLTEQRHRDQLVLEARRKDEFLAMLAHELRNPIAPIRYAAERMRTADAEPERLRWARDIITRQIDQLTHLVDDLLDVSRITRGKISLTLARVEIETLIARAVEAVRPLIEARKQNLQISNGPPGLCIMADATRLAQVISNLLNNAAKFTPERGSISLRVEPETDGPGQAADWVRIVVADDGVGISPDVLPEMFGLFAQAETTQKRAQGGLGIGLTLVRSFVEMHGGTVLGACEGLGRGSAFTVRLPLLPPGPAAEIGSRQTQTLAAAVPRKVLIVDDNHDVADSLAEWLRDFGHEVWVANSGESALRQAQKIQPDLMLVDIGLPDMSGLDVARRLRSLREMDHTVLVAVTGYGQAQDRRRSQEAGFDHHWIKPLSTADLSGLFGVLDSRATAAGAQTGRRARQPARGRKPRRSPRP
jgi:PAS domain S-box-containing protein